ncbi:TetR/AcrR family transcriptional regulator [Litorivivens sp.]|uniref:TetR/AcrR family transcriptional regulator n=1 Tax=Litorivivens sp. TaxID=2020868 RepID=UPI003565455C
MSRQAVQAVELTDRRKQILQAAIEIIATEGYSALGMRSLARASGLKLGALQYHFANWEALLVALASYISDVYKAGWHDLQARGVGSSPVEFIQMLLEDAPGNALLSDRLWPQLWAMGQVEPLVKELVDGIYAQYLSLLERALKTAGSPAPRIEAIALMSLVEGSTIFIGEGRRWEKHRKQVEKFVLDAIRERSGA